MTTSITTPISVRIPQPMRAWLENYATGEHRSLNAAIVGLVKIAMQAEPLEIFIHECQSPTGAFFTASIGKNGSDFYEGDDREAAFCAALAKAKELGLSAKSIRLASENFNH